MSHSSMILTILFALWSFGNGQREKPHIVFVLADDLGFNDVGYHGRSEIETPCIDRLATGGLTMENYYVQPICSPSRSQLMSGRYQIHTGLQHSVIHPYRPFGLPLDNKILPEQLKSCGYSTHMVGKWHLGLHRSEYLPWNRGFDDFVGILTGGAEHYTYVKSSVFRGGAMYDSKIGPTKKYNGRYSTNLYTKKAMNVIDSHNVSNPLFLYLAYQAPHAPLRTPPGHAKAYKQIRDAQRRTYAQMVTHMDNSICKVVRQLRRKRMWNDTIFVFSTDNGGQPSFGGNNWPLRGSKGTLWEGGIRGVGFVSGGFRTLKRHISHQLFHISDWMPTLLNASSCPLLENTPPLDGVNQWGSLSRGEPSGRKEILYNIDPMSMAFRKKKYSVRNGFDTRVKAAIRHGQWKLITGNPGPGSWFQPPEYKGMIITTRRKRRLYRLFNIRLDPYEKHDMAKERPDIVDHLLRRMATYNHTSVPVIFPDLDPNSNPALHNGFWGPWLDDKWQMDISWKKMSNRKPQTHGK